VSWSKGSEESKAGIMMGGISTRRGERSTFKKKYEGRGEGEKIFLRSAIESPPKKRGEPMILQRGAQWKICIVKKKIRGGARRGDRRNLSMEGGTKRKTAKKQKAGDIPTYVILLCKQLSFRARCRTQKKGLAPASPSRKG